MKKNKNIYSGPIKFSTTNEIPGYTIIEHKDIVYERVVSGVGFVTEFFASITDVWGGRSGTMEGQLDSLYESLRSGIARRAKNIGANAIIGFSIDVDEISGKGTFMLMISGTGTAVVIAEGSSNIESSSMTGMSNNQDDTNEWKCTKCGTLNEPNACFCIKCGERKPAGWKCSGCGSVNGRHISFCPACGKKREAQDEQLLSDEIAEKRNREIASFKEGEVLEKANGMSTAREIDSYLRELFKDSESEEVAVFLNALQDFVKTERMYGNGKNDAYRLLKTFLEQEMQVFTIDTNASEVICPVCGSKRPVVAKYCGKCYATFKVN